MKQNHNLYLKLAFEQARINLGSTRTNPSVGCVIEKNNTIISSGHTSINGRPHAEYNALNKSINFKNSNLYVTLEPCSHIGKTPPCANIIIKKKIKRVFFSIKDPNPITHGKSLKIFKNNGVKVFTKLNKTRLTNFYKSYFNQYKKPPQLFIEGKLAISDDYFTKNVKSKWITNFHSRQLGNFLRSEYNCLISTSKTLNNDNALFNCRIDGLENKSPDLIIIDRKLKIKNNLKIFKKKIKRKIILITCIKKSKKISFLKKNNVQVCLIKSLNRKEDFQKIINLLKKKGYNRIFVECGVVFLEFLIKNKFLSNLYIFKSDKKLKKFGRKPIKYIIKRKLKFKNLIKVNLYDNKLFKEKIS